MSFQECILVPLNLYQKSCNEDKTENIKEKKIKPKHVGIKESKPKGKSVTHKHNNPQINNWVSYK